MSHTPKEFLLSRAHGAGIPHPIDRKPGEVFKVIVMDITFLLSKYS